MRIGVARIFPAQGSTALTAHGRPDRSIRSRRELRVGSTSISQAVRKVAPATEPGRYGPSLGRQPQDGVQPSSIPPAAAPTPGDARSWGGGRGERGAVDVGIRPLGLTPLSLPTTSVQ